MGEVSCGSHKGKWSYLYAGGYVSRLQQKNLSLLRHICWLHLERKQEKKSKIHCNCRVHIELERSRDLGYQRQPSPQMDRFRALGIDRAVENAELQDKLEKAQNELRRAQAELRLNQSDYERSQVEMEQMQEKVCPCMPPELPTLIKAKF